MPFVKEPEISQTLKDEVVFPPGDLWSDEPPLESDLHRDQIELLICLLKYFWQERQDFYVTGNLTVYYSPNQRKSEDFRGPDFFAVLGTEKKDRKSWVVWQEDGKYPNIIIELLSDSTAAVDRGLKKQIYQDTFRTPDYFWFDPVTLEFQGFELLSGSYQALRPDERGWLWSQQLQLFLGVHQSKLRFFTPEGQLVPTPAEVAEQERLGREQAEQRAAELAEQLSRYREQFGDLPE